MQRKDKKRSKGGEEKNIQSAQCSYLNVPWRIRGIPAFQEAEQLSRKLNTEAVAKTFSPVGHVYNQKSKLVNIKATMTKEVQTKIPILQPPTSVAEFQRTMSFLHSHFPRSYFPIGLGTDWSSPELQRQGARSLAILLLGAVQVHSLPGTRSV